MNTLIKILAAIALIAVIIAAVVYMITTLNGPDNTSGSDPTDRVVPTDVQPKTNGQAGRSPTVAGSGETIKVKADDPLLPEYRPINSPEILQNMREEGKTYCSAIVGKVSGRARKEAWLVTLRSVSVQGSASFNYIYMMKTTGKIIQNDGTTIVEERSFDCVSEDCVVSDISVGLSLPETGILSKLIDPFVRTKSMGLMSGSEAIGLTNRALQFKVSEERLRELGFDIKGKLKMFTQGKDARILEGKKVRIVFKDGKGIEDITPINCELTKEEEDVIKRTNYAMDHYLMPDKEVAVGATWTINADVFSGLLDPRLEGKVKGKVTVERVSDFRTKTGVNTRLRLTDGNISVVKPEKGNTVSGEITQITGRASRPDKLDVVKSAWLQGYVQYKEVSTDHLLYEAKMETEPRFEVRYECEVKDN